LLLPLSGSRLALMFEWIPWVAGIFILAWAFFAGFMALRGSAEAGLHEVAPDPATQPVERSAVVDVGQSGARVMPFRLIQALQFMLAAGVIAAGTWLLVQTVT
jgi:hypothetical protein